MTPDPDPDVKSTSLFGIENLTNDTRYTWWGT